ncbi:hypothetical protein PY365_15565 [Roseiarcaceae bacterium H3SJ34-1]|uniref:hypothetical protein n=1 Tax=Terripilifer ovatus TaxID=3032367 RepID=UPI003AB99BCE|nr:hypothetical protein [Roseiarcaceae bacterium H3SJ34-1]
MLVHDAISSLPLAEYLRRSKKAAAPTPMLSKKPQLQKSTGTGCASPNRNTGAGTEFYFDNFYTTF